MGNATKLLTPVSFCQVPCNWNARKKCILAKSPAEEAFSFVRVKCTSLSLHNSQSVNFCEDLSSTEAVVTMGASLIKHILFC